MDTLQLITFLGGGSLVASLIVGGTKRFLGGVENKYGRLTTQFLLLVVVVLVSGILWAFQYLPADILTTVYLIFSGAITLYEVAYRAIWKEAIRGE